VAEKKSLPRKHLKSKGRGRSSLEGGCGQDLPQPPFQAAFSRRAPQSPAESRLQPGLAAPRLKNMWHCAWALPAGSVAAGVKLKYPYGKGKGAKQPTAPLGVWAPAVGLAWLIPGGGHLLLKRTGRGVLLNGLDHRMFLCGLMMRGAMFQPQSGDIPHRPQSTPADSLAT